jgi:hypothetical protein
LAILGYLVTTSVTILLIKAACVLLKLIHTIQQGRFVKINHFETKQKLWLHLPCYAVK